MPFTNLVAVFFICCTVFGVALARYLRPSVPSKCPHCGHAITLIVSK